MVKVWYSKITACQGLQGERAKQSKGYHGRLLGALFRMSEQVVPSMLSTFYKLFGGKENSLMAKFGGAAPTGKGATCM